MQGSERRHNRDNAFKNVFCINEGTDCWNKWENCETTSQQSDLELSGWGTWHIVLKSAGFQSILKRHSVFICDQRSSYVTLDPFKYHGFFFFFFFSTWEQEAEEGQHSWEKVEPLFKITSVSSSVWGCSVEESLPSADSKGSELGRSSQGGTPARRGPGQGLEPGVEFPLASFQICQYQHN